MLPPGRKSKRLLRKPIRKQNLVDRDTEVDVIANSDDGKSELFYISYWEYLQIRVKLLYMSCFVNS